MSTYLWGPTSDAADFDLGVADGNPQLAPLADLPPIYTKIAATKPKLFRMMCPWNFVAKAQDPGTAVAGAVPPTTTGRDWTYVDRCINDILLRTGADILMIIGQGRPSWGGFQFLWFSFGATVGNAVDYGHFVTEVVNRYKPGGVGIRTDGIYAPNAGKGVTRWEIWNEENSQLWGANVNPADYTEYVKNAYNAIKAIQPGAASVVVYGGLQHVQRETVDYLGYGSNNLDELTFLSRCYDAGIKGYFDVVATHIYTQTDTIAGYPAVPGTTPGPAPATTTDNWQQVLAIRALMAAKSDVKDMWITECGFATQNLSEALQNTYMQQLLVQLSGLPYVKAVIIYNARDMGTDTTNVENTWGYLHYDLANKPLYDWLVSIVPNPNKTVTPLPASLVITGSHPALDTTVRPAAALVVVVRGTPVVAATAHKLLTPTPAGLGITPAAPVVTATANVFVAPAPASLLIFPGTPVLGSTITVSPSNGSLFATGAIPVVTVTANKAVTPTAQPMAITTSAPVVSVTDNKVVTPGAAALVVTTSAPTVTATNNKVVTPTAAALVITTSAPTVTATSQTAPVFDAAATGANTNGFIGTLVTTWSHTCTGTNRVVFVAFEFRAGGQSAAVGSQTRTVTYGGVAMTVVSQLPLPNDTACAVEVWKLVNPPTGAQTVSVSVGNGTNTGRACAGVSVSYTGANQTAPTGTPVTATGNSAAQAVTLSSAPTRRPFYGVGVVSGGTITFPAGENKRGGALSGDGFSSCSAGDATGAASVSLSSTSGSGAWGAVGFDVLPV